jgi:hypothetical protein
MGKIYFLSILILIASFPFKVNAQNNYTYKILFNFGSIDNNQSVSTTTHLFSTFDNFLFEYIIEEKRETKLNIGRDSIDRVEEKVKFDTVGVQVIDIVKKRYVQIDRFSKKFKVLSNGDYINSPIGLKLNATFRIDPEKNQNLSFSDTLISNQKFQYSSDTIRNINSADSVISKAYFIHFDNLYTLWTILGMPKANEKLTFVGFSTSFIDQKITISLHVRDIQLLGKKEEEISREICERLRVEGVIK